VRRQPTRQAAAAAAAAQPPPPLITQRQQAHTRRQRAHAHARHQRAHPPGGGNVLNVQRTVRQLISVGAKGCFLEDQAWPKKVSGSRNRSVISMEDFAAKV
jgi:hypothetical protein